MLPRQGQVFKSSVLFYGISTLACYLLPNPRYTYIENICDL